MAEPSPRPEILRQPTDDAVPATVARPLTIVRRLAGNEALRKALIVAALVATWQAYAVWNDNPLVFPTFVDTVEAFRDAVVDGALVTQTLYSLRLLLQGYAAGIVLATVLSVLAVRTRLGGDLLDTLTAMFSPLPAIALLPLALLWFGIGRGSLVFVLIHSVMWPVSLNMHSGFRGVSPTLRMVGANYGLSGLAYVRLILLPAAFPSILAGLKIGWAFAWRTLIAAELVFGVSSGSGGLGWFIYANKNTLDIPAVFAGLLTVILIGLVVENLIFRTIEHRTVRRWGMQT
jgi:NitT/TauT family transport system permease protein